MHIGGSREGASGREDRRPAATRAPADKASRALTVVTAPAAREASPMTRGNAAFLAHLIATNAQAPQTRARRRAEPAEALAAYRAAAALKN
jgi:hypothetical protein